MKKITFEAPIKNFWSNPIYIVACGFGTGLSSKAPGTVGTLVGVLIYFFIQHLVLPFYLLVTLIVIGVGIPICSIAERDFGVKDHPAIVWDEVAGYLVTMFSAPEGILWIVIGFGLFRAFDIFKPWPINLAQKRFKGGFGVMFDDIIAGGYAWIIMQCLAWFWFLDS